MGTHPIFESDFDCLTVQMGQRTVALTGTSSGIGFEVLCQLASKSLDISFILINRTADDNKRAIAELLKIAPAAKFAATYAVNLAELDDVIQVAERIRSSHSKIDVLILNAGVMLVPFSLSHIGVETHHQINSDIGARVIATSSVAHVWCGDEFEYAELKPSSVNYGKGITAYGESKLAVILWIRHMARLQPRVHFYSVHPGICRTNLFRHRQSWWLRLLLATPLAQSAATGAEGSTFLALADTRLLTSGAYYAAGQMRPVSISGHVKQRADAVFRFAEAALRTTLEQRKKRN